MLRSRNRECHLRYPVPKTRRLSRGVQDSTYQQVLAAAQPGILEYVPISTLEYSTGLHTEQRLAKVLIGGLGCLPLVAKCQGYMDPDIFSLPGLPAYPRICGLDAVSQRL